MPSYMLTFDKCIPNKVFVQWCKEYLRNGYFEQKCHEIMNNTKVYEIMIYYAKTVNTLE